jgi:hypothetical protein
MLERLERPAQREQRRAQVVGDRGDHEAPVALGGRRGGQGVAQPAGHAAQRVADLSDLAGARGEGLDIELAAGDAVGVGGQARQRRQDPAPQEDDDDADRGDERHEPGAERDGPARPGALARHPERSDRVRELHLRLAIAAGQGLLAPIVGDDRLQPGRLEQGTLAHRELGRGDRLLVRRDHRLVRDHAELADLGLHPEALQALRGGHLPARAVESARAQQRLGVAQARRLPSGLPLAGPGPAGSDRKRRHGNDDDERQGEPCMQGQRARAHRAAGGSKR